MPRAQQRLEVERRGHQRARPRHPRQRGGDVGRVERPSGIERRAAQQGQQHARLEAVAVLRRHGGHQRQPGERRAPDQLGQALGLGADVGHQRAPALGMRLRRAGRARSQQAYRLEVGGDARHGARVGKRRARRRPRHVQSRQGAGVQRGVVGQHIGRGAGGGHLAQRVGQRVGGHQAGLPAQQRGRQAEREVVAVLAQVDRPAAGGQLPGQRHRLGDEAAGADRPALAPGQRRREVGRAEQRQVGAHRRELTPCAPAGAR